MNILGRKMLCGDSATAFVNWLIETYRSIPEHVNYTDNFQKTEDW